MKQQLIFISLLVAAFSASLMKRISVSKQGKKKFNLFRHIREFFILLKSQLAITTGTDVKSFPVYHLLKESIVNAHSLRRARLLIQIKKEKEKYYNAISNNEMFEKLKSIRVKIKKLESAYNLITS